ncbi:MAG: GNAT family N-acetyltransferase [Cohaesibacteraceae bacterium]|nr:GNAT family N-acetyltransferase [Cohaesibacteraceae bacterium]
MTRTERGNIAPSEKKMPDNPISIRSARKDEVDLLNKLAFQSKAHWGYDSVFMEQCIEALAVDPDAVRLEWVFVAENEHGKELGFAAILPLDDGHSYELSHLFVTEESMGKGIGRVLFREAVKRVSALGGSTIEILSDPGARPFYEKLGAVYIEDAPSDAIEGRSLPLLEYSF